MAENWSFYCYSLKKPFPEAHRLALIISFIALSLFSLLILVTAPLHINVWVVIAFLYFSLYHEWKQRRYLFMRFLLGALLWQKIHPVHLEADSGR